MGDTSRQSILQTAGGVTLLGMVINMLLAGLKIACGLLCRSQTILADGVHSLTDLVTDLAVIATLRVGDRPADTSHPYGHRRVHTLTAMFVGIGLLGAAALIGYRAIVALHHMTEPIRSPLPLILAILTVPTKEILYRLTMRVARTTTNPALEANAWHHRTDAITSLAATLGIAGAMFLGPTWAMLDSLTAAVLSAFLIVEAYKMTRAAAGELVDSAPDAKQLDGINEVVGQTPGVKDFHALRARTLGGKVDMDLHVLVDPNLTVSQGHDIAAEVRKQIKAANPNVQQVIVHIEPYQQTTQT